MANNAPVDMALANARTAIDRLDLKGGIKICTQIIESDDSNKFPALLLRSPAYQKSNKPFDSRTDAENSVDLKETPESLSRAGFASLACALHFLDRAEGLTQEGKKVLESQVRDKNLVEVIDEIKRLMLREESFLEKRLTPEVFLSIITHCDSKTIAASLGVNKLWKSWILESKAVFSHFEMVGNVAEIIKGIQFFGERSNHSLESVDIKIKESPTAHQREQLRISISRSSKTVKRLSIGYLRSQKFPGGAGYSEDLSQLIIDIAASCSNLLLLESYGGGADWLFDSESHPSVEFPSHFGAKLQKFIWRAGGENLVCNDTLARCLQEASEVVIWSSKIQPSWIIGLLSSNSNLVKVKFPFHSPQFVKDIPILNLPKLKRLFLYGSLYSATEDGRWFWRKLQAPSLTYLRIIQLNAKEFSSFQAPVSPIFWLDIGSIDFETQSGEEAAFSLVECIKGWNTVAGLTLELPTSTPSTFWIRLIQLLTPLHLENWGAGFEDKLILPNLQYLDLGMTSLPYTSQIPLYALKSLVAARVSSMRGMSRAEIYHSAQTGEIERFDTSAQTDAPAERTKSLTSLTIELPITDFKAEDKEWFESHGTNFISKANST